MSTEQGELKDLLYTTDVLEISDDWYQRQSEFPLSNRAYVLDRPLRVVAEVRIWDEDKDHIYIHIPCVIGRSGVMKYDAEFSIDEFGMDAIVMTPWLSEEREKYIALLERLIAAGITPNDRERPKWFYEAESQINLSIVHNRLQAITQAPEIVSTLTSRGLDISQVRDISFISRAIRPPGYVPDSDEMS